MDQNRHEKDAATLYAMASIYCNAMHTQAPKGEHGICSNCEALVLYSLERADGCPNGHEQNCADCEIHCYKPQMREEIRCMMRYAAPRMVYKHPIMTIGFVRKKLKTRHKK